MKPTTKLQREVVDLASRLLRITEDEKQWAYKNCLPHKGFATKKNVLCLDCGESFSSALVKRKVAICPHCETKIQVEQSRKTTYKHVNYFATAEIFGEFQIVRNYEVFGYYKKGEPVRYYLHEIIQYWIQPDLKTTMFGLNHNTQGYCDSWGGSMEIRKENNRSWSGAKYDVYPRLYHPDSVFKQEYLKIGINHNLKGLTLLEAITIIPKKPILETLIKSNQYNLLGVESWKLDKRWSSLKICLRNKFKIKEATIYFDYLDLLEYFKKDMLNSVYVCPKNLKKEHDRLMKKKRAILEIEQRERNRQETIKRQQKLENAIKEYIKRNQKFFDLEIVKGNVSIKLLQSVDEFKEEGDELNHCVFTNEYYLKANSLIFSARVDGKRTETIELKLDKMKVEQSRGISNNPSKYHNDIIVLMNKNISKIRTIIKNTDKQEQFSQHSA